MPLQVLKWNMVPGLDLPLPELKDDSDKFPPRLVVDVRAWIKQRQAQLAKQLETTGPTAQTIHLARTMLPMPQGGMGMPGTTFDMPYDVLAPSKPGEINFEYGTFEVLLRDTKRAMIIAKFEYAGARQIGTTNVIIGDLLQTIPLAQASPIVTATQ